MTEQAKRYRIPIYRVALVREGSHTAERKYATDSEAVARILREYLDGIDREHFCVVMLDTKNKVIGIHTVSIGTLDAALATPREVFKPAILCNAASVILGHNHPSGDPAPSRDDHALTKRLTDAGEMLGIKVLDHVVIGELGRYYTFTGCREGVGL